MSPAASSHGVRVRYSVALCLLLSPLACSQSVEYAEPDRNCLAVDDPLRGSADRSATQVVLGWRFWDSQQLVTKIAEIVLREMLGYDVSILPCVYRTDQWYLDLTEENVDVSLEQWYLVTTSPTYIKYVVTDRSVHHLSFLGYVGRSGLYTSQLAVGRDPFVGYYKFYQNTTRAIEIGFVTHGTSRAAEIAEGWPVCTTNFSSWCGTGQFEGYYATPECYDDPDTCVEVLHVSPFYESGNLEMLARNNHLRAIFSYMGMNDAIRQSEIINRFAEGLPQLFFHWEPDAFLLRTEVSGVRIQFPDYYLGCDRTNNKNPNTGGMSCDLVEDPLQNLVAARLRLTAPEAYYFVSQLYITPDQINHVIRRTMADQGDLDFFDAACEFIQSNRLAFVQMAPTCITHPPDVVENGDIVFNTESLQCENATILQEATPTACASQNLTSSASRKDTTITLVRRDWLTHELVTAVAEVMLRDYLGYTVRTRINDVTTTAEWGNDMINLGLYDIDMESWRIVEGSESYVTYIDSRLVLLAGLTGFAGRSGVFVSNAALEKAPFASYYKFYQNLTTATANGLLLHDVATFATSECPQDWCGTGALKGFWAPSQCLSTPYLCGQLIHRDTLLDTSYVEQLLEQNDVDLVVGYFGDDVQQMIRSYVDSGTLVPFYWWEPDAFMSQLDVSRLSFPDNFKGCSSSNTYNPNTGSISCDFPEVSPMKLFRAGLLNVAPEAYYAIDLVQLSRDELEVMMAQHASVGGSMSTAELACQWISENSPTVNTWAPECLRNPIAFEELTVDSTVFDPEQLLCGPVKQCPSNSILRYINLFICEECGPGDVPDAEQKGCITCDGGFEENADGSQCVPCPPGKAKDFGEVACSECEPGQFARAANMSTCEFCFGATYASEPGQTECRSCDDQYINSVAMFLGAKNKSECDCPMGSYLPIDGWTCIPCPDGFRCPTAGTHEWYFVAGYKPASGAFGGARVLWGGYPLVETGYMTLPDEPLRVYLCHDAEHCPGGDPGTCAPFRDKRKVACGECTDGAYESGSACKECQGFDFVPLIVVGVCAVLMASMAVRFLNGNILMKSSNALLVAVLGGLIMTAIQTLTVFKQMGVRWMNPFEVIMDSMSFITFNLEFVRIGCVLGSGRVSGYLMRQCIAPAAILLLLVLLRVKKHFLPKTKLQNEFINTTGTVFNIFFISIVVSALSPHVCYDHPGDVGSSVISDPSILCDYTSEHMSIVIIGCFATLCVPIPFLGLVTYAVLRYPFIVRQSIRSDDFLAAFRFLFVRFQPQVYWFAIIVAGRSLFICLIPVIFSVAASQVMAMTFVLCSYMIVQQTARPWRAVVANFVDMCMGVGLVMLLTAIAVLTDFQKGASAVRAAGVLAMLVVVIAPATVVVIMQYKALAASRYEQFICHHKAGAGAQARLMKMLLVHRHGKNVFIDSDNLVELDGLFDIVKTKVRVLVVYLSRDTLTRPWCVGEICTSFECHKRIVTVQTGSWEMPEESEIDQMPDLIDKTGCNLQEQGISEEIVATSLRRIVSDEVPTIVMDSSLIGGAKFLRIAQQLTESSLFKDFGTRQSSNEARHVTSDGTPERATSSPAAKASSTPAKQMRAEPGCLVACADPADDEAVAAVSILLMKVNDQVVALGVPCVVNVTDHAQATNDPAVLEEALYATQASRAVIVILTRRSLEVFLQISMIVVGMAASCTMIPVSVWDFNFPTATYYATQLPQQWPSLNALPVTEAEGHLKSFFKLITVFLSTMGSDQVLNVNGASVVSRVPEHYDPSKQRSLSSIVRAIVVAATAGTDKRVSVREEPTEEQRLMTNKLQRELDTMQFGWKLDF